MKQSKINQYFYSHFNIHITFSLCSKINENNIFCTPNNENFLNIFLLICEIEDFEESNLK